MLRGDWRGPAAYVILGAIILAAIIVATWDTATYLEKQRQGYQRSATAHAQQADQRIDSECTADIGLVAYRACIREVLKSEEDQKRAERDLDAQETMALFTRIMGITGLVGLVVGLGSVYLIWATLRETQRMARDTREIGEAQVRAYISFQRIHLRFDGVNAYVDVSVRNVGQSPARNIHLHSSVGVENVKGLGVPRRRFYSAFKNKRMDGLAPGEKSDMVFEIPADAYSFLMGNRGPNGTYMKVFGRVEWDTVFPDDRHNEWFSVITDPDRQVKLGDLEKYRKHQL